MDYAQQIAGGLTDDQFKENAKQSFRARNFFQPIINIPAAIFNYNLSGNTRLQITSNGVFGERNSVQFINTPNILDTFNAALDSCNPRQVDRDYYSGFTTEARLLHSYSIGFVKNVLSAGLRYFNETTKRKQKGVGTTGSDFDLSLTKYYTTDLHFTTHNEAAFAENMFQLTKRFSVTPGFRYELIQTNFHGIISDTVHVTYKGKRNFPLFGTGLQYQISNTTQLYGNISQAYRPYLYANVTPADRVDVIDPNLKDSKGYDIDLGYRGHYKDAISFDVNAYYLFYGDRIGLITQSKDNSTYLLTTNIGNSVAKSIEAYVNISLLYFINHDRKNYDIRLFNSLAYDHARFTSAS
jgi:Fe(3+) dicitrate transport protein